MNFKRIGDYWNFCFIYINWRWIFVQLGYWLLFCYFVLSLWIWWYFVRYLFTFCNVLLVSNFCYHILLLNFYLRLFEMFFVWFLNWYVLGLNVFHSDFRWVLSLCVKNDFCWYCIHSLRIRLCCSDIVVIDHSWKRWVAFFLYSFQIIFIFGGSWRLYELCFNWLCAFYPMVM